jgi:hypothetical protein
LGGVGGSGAGFCFTTAGAAASAAFFAALRAASCNLKAGITKPSRYEPGVNRTYQDLADHYGFVVLPARIRRPRDKAKVEAAVGIVSRFLLGKLRNRRFFSLVELNDTGCFRRKPVPPSRRGPVHKSWSRSTAS